MCLMTLQVGKHFSCYVSIFLDRMRHQPVTEAPVAHRIAVGRASAGIVYLLHLYRNFFLSIPVCVCGVALEEKKSNLPCLLSVALNVVCLCVCLYMLEAHLGREENNNEDALSRRMLCNMTSQIVTIRTRFLAGTVCG